MVRAIIQYETEPDPERYKQHVDEFVSPIDCSAFRHGKVFGSPFGEPKYRYHAEFESDGHGVVQVRRERRSVRGFRKDAMAMGIPFTVHFASVE